MCDAGGEPTDRCQAFAVHQFFLQQLHVGHVLEQHEAGIGTGAVGGLRQALVQVNAALLCAGRDVPVVQMRTA